MAALRVSARAAPFRAGPLVGLRPCARDISARYASSEAFSEYSNFFLLFCGKIKGLLRSYPYLEV